VDDGLGFLEFGDREGTAQAADTALLEAAFGEAVVDRRPRVRPDGARVDLAADAAADVDAAGEDAGPVAQTAVPRPGRRLERAPGGRDGRASLCLATVSLLAQYRSGSGVDRFRDRVGPNPSAVDPVLGDLTHVRAPSVFT
jgi:hypothetical protein